MQVQSSHFTHSGARYGFSYSQHSKTYQLLYSGGWFLLLKFMDKFGRLFLRPTAVHVKLIDGSHMSDSWMQRLQRYIPDLVACFRLCGGCKGSKQLFGNCWISDLIVFVASFISSEFSLILIISRLTVYKIVALLWVKYCWLSMDFDSCWQLKIVCWKRGIHNVCESLRR